MTEYETKSLEELRMDDYIANRKGPQAGGAVAPRRGCGLFGAPHDAAGGSRLCYGGIIRMRLRQLTCRLVGVNAQFFCSRLMLCA